MSADEDRYRGGPAREVAGVLSTATDPVSISSAGNAGTHVVRSTVTAPVRKATLLVGRAKSHVDASCTEILRLTGRLRQLADHERLLADTEWSSVSRELATTNERERAAVHAQAGESLGAIADVLSARAAVMAASPSGRPWTASEWLSSDPLRGNASGGVRLGTLSLPMGRGMIPAFVQLMGTPGWAVTGSIADCGPLLFNSVLRVVAATDPLAMRLTVHDPHIDGVFSSLAPLRQAAGLFDEPVTSEEQLRTALAEAVEAVARTADLLGSAGHRTLAEYHAATGRHAGLHRLLVLLRYPAGIDENAQEQLVRLVANGAGRGLSMLIHHDPGVEPDHRVNPEALLSRLARIHGSGSTWSASPLGSLPLHPDPAAGRSIVDGVCTAVTVTAGRGTGPVVPFQELLDAAEIWSGSADEGLLAVLGKEADRPFGLELRSSNPPQPNVLIGGAVGQGKSNLLLALIHAFAARYSPDDLRMYLLDFKEGLEFARLGPDETGMGWLPHAEVLGLESDREFGLSVLDHLVSEFHRRAQRFKLVGASDLLAFRRAAGPGEAPRILVVIDEFQVLLTGDDDITSTAVGHLETLARKGRAYGIHLVLASQTLSGVRSLLSAQDAIFSQFAHRIALKTTAAESQVLLGPQNTEAARLRFRGEAVVNSNFGAVDDNRRITVAYADETYLGSLRRQLWDRSPARELPRIFYGGRPASLPDAWRRHGRTLARTGFPADTAASRIAWLGQPVAVSQEPIGVVLSKDPGRGLAVVGDGATQAIGALSAAVLSLAEQHEPGTARFVILDPASDGAFGNYAASAAAGRGHEVRQVPTDEIGVELFSLRDAVQGRTDDLRNGSVTTYVVAAGMHRAPRMTAGVDGDDYNTPASALKEIVEQGATEGLLVLGWWNNLRILERHLDYRRGGIESYLFLRASREDVGSVIGPSVSWSARQNRGLYWDSANLERPVVIVPFEAPGDELLDLARSGT